MFSEFISLFDMQRGENHCALKKHIVQYTFFVLFLI